MLPSRPQTTPDAPVPLQLSGQLPLRLALAVLIALLLSPSHLSAAVLIAWVDASGTSPIPPLLFLGTVVQALWVAASRPYGSRLALEGGALVLSWWSLGGHRQRLALSTIDRLDLIAGRLRVVRRGERPTVVLPIPPTQHAAVRRWIAEVDAWRPRAPAASLREGWITDTTHDGARLLLRPALAPPGPALIAPLLLWGWLAITTYALLWIWPEGLTADLSLRSAVVLLSAILTCLALTAGAARHTLTQVSALELTLSGPQLLASASLGLRRRRRWSIGLADVRRTFTDRRHLHLEGDHTQAQIPLPSLSTAAKDELLRLLREQIERARPLRGTVPDSLGALLASARAPGHPQPGSLQPHEAPAPGQESSAPNLSGDVQIHAGGALERAGGALGHAAPDQRRPGSPQVHVGNAPDLAGSAPDLAGSASDHANSASHLPGNDSDHADSASHLPGNDSDHAGIAPNHADSAPNHAGSAPALTGSAPGPAGGALERAGGAPERSAAAHPAEARSCTEEPSSHGAPAPAHAGRAHADAPPSAVRSQRAALYQR